mmetsp:Transcript_24370/g.36564  ORF Transcript_24370/g.36564 Transcript_24370/m.36564 type:complete len:285 (+) Transcript_24370:47-901(+)
MRSLLLLLTLNTCVASYPAISRTRTHLSRIRVLRPCRAEVGGQPTRLKLPRWDGENGMSVFLNEQGLKSLDPLEVRKKMSQGWVLVDVRRADQFEESRAAGSVNVELFKLLPFSMNFREGLKYLITSSQGVTPVDPNPNFVEEVQSLLSQRGVKGVIFADAEGGCLDDAGGQLGKYGASGRSLVAAYRMIAEGGETSSKISHLKYGLNNWFDNELPADGMYEWIPEARTPTGGLGKPKTSAKRREDLANTPKWKRYLDAFGGITMAEEAMRSEERKQLKKDGDS